MYMYIKYIVYVMCDNNIIIVQVCLLGYTMYVLALCVCVCVRERERARLCM